MSIKAANKARRGVKGGRKHKTNGLKPEQMTEKLIYVAINIKK